MPETETDSKPVADVAVEGGSPGNTNTESVNDTAIDAPQEKHVYYKSDRSGSNNSNRQKRRSYSSYGNPNYNDKSHQPRGNRYINSGGNYYNNTARYNAGSGFNRSVQGFNPQQQAQVPNMGWQGYYANPMYYMPQQMAMMNGGMYLDPSQYIHGNEDADGKKIDNEISAGETNSSVPEVHHTKIEITTKTGERLNLSAMHDHKNQVDGASKSTDESSSSPEATVPTPDANDEEQKQNELVAQKEAEKEKNRKAFLEQVRLRKLALDAKNKKVETEVPDEVEKVVTVDQSSAAEPPSVEIAITADTNTNTEVEPPIADRHVQIKTPEPFRNNDNDNDEELQNESHESNVSDDDNENDDNSSIEHNDNDDEVDDDNDKTTSDALDENKTPADSNDESAGEQFNGLTVSELLERLNTIPAIEDIYKFNYPSPFTPPEEHYRKDHIKYTYGPLFLLQFQDKVKTKADEAWITSTKSKIVIPIGGNNRFKGRDNSRRNSSARNMDNRMGSSRMSSKRQSRKFDDRKSGRTSYTSRRDRERAGMDHSMGSFNRPSEKPLENVAPLVPTANRWVPKSRQKKVEKKFAPDGVTELLTPDEVESKMKSLLNKLTLEKFDSISTEILTIANISKWEEDGATLQNVIQQIFNKATDEPHWSSMYAQLCGKLVKDIEPEIADNTQDDKTGPKLVLHYLVDICHTEFEKGWVDKLPTNPDGTPLEPEMMSEEYYQAAAAKRRGLGLVRLIGFLYRLNLLSGKMMFESFRRLMKDLTDSPSEEVIESVIELLTTVGEKFETDSFKAGRGTLEGSVLLDSLFGILDNIVEEGKISNRIKFKLLDIKELREKKHWNSDKKNAGPKTIQQIHQEEEQARQLKNARGSSQRRNNGDRTRHSNWGGSNNSRRDVRRDSFTSTRTGSSRYSQRGTPQKEEKPKRPVNTNRFSALMHDSGDF